MIRWIRRRPLAVAYVLIVASFASGLAGVQWEAEQRATQDQHQAQAVTQDLCRTVDQQRELLAALLDVVLSDDGRGLPLTQLPEFRALDPDTQAYLVALEAISAVDDPNSLDDRLRRFAAERLTPAECAP